MKNPIRSFLCCLLGATSAAYAATPAMDVTVSDPGGKVAFRGKTDAKGTFSTGTLAPGNYTVQFNSKGLHNGQYAVVVSAGKKKVSADAVIGDKFAKGGVAMKVDVGAGLKITGQVAPSGGETRPGMVWIPPQLGSNMPGHWVPDGSPEAVQAKTRKTMSRKDVESLTEKSFNPQG